MLRFIKRGEISSTKRVLIRTLAIILAFVLSGIIIYVSTGNNPVLVYVKMLQGTFGSRYRFNQVIIKVIPLTITSLGIAAAFKMKFWNIGGDGQICMGAFAASFIALNFSNLPSIILLPFMALAGILAGGLWALIPAFFKVKWGTNETITTLMLNYIALKFITYLQFGPWRDPKATGFPKIANFSKGAVLPQFLGIHIGWIIALILVILMYIFMNYSKLGYETAVIGESEKTAQYAGIDIKKTMIIIMLISGGLCGLAGMIEASAVCNTLSVDVSQNVGYTAIIITWLSSLSAPLIVIVSVLFAALVQGASYIQTAFNIPSSIALMLQGIILFFVLGSEIFVQYRLISQKKLEQKIADEIAIVNKTNFKNKSSGISLNREGI